MYGHALDRYSDYIQARTQDRAEFEEKYGALAGTFLAELAPLFHFYRRLPFDFDVPLDVRHLAGTSALYIAEHQDFLDDSPISGAGLIDDVYVAFASLLPVVSGARGIDLSRHWRAETSFDDVQGMAHNLGALVEVVPTKVKENADRLLGIAD